MILEHIFYVNLLILFFYQLIDAKIESNDVLLGNATEIFQVAEKVMKHCFKLKTSLLIMNENTENSLSLNSIFHPISPINLIGTNENNAFTKHKRFQIVYKINETHFSKQNRPATSVAFMVSSNETLAFLLEDMRNSIWWNHEALFLIVNVNTENSCLMAHSFLHTMWNFHILSVVYLCRTIDNNLFFHTYNPFANLAPIFWKFVRYNRMINEHYTLFEHFIHKPYGSTFTYDSSICNILYFDKTNNLNGYNIKASKVFYLNEPIDVIKEINTCIPAENQIIDALLAHLNVNVSTKFFNEFGFIDEHGEPQGPIKEVLTGKIDITTTAYFVRDYWKHQLYPFHETSIRIASSIKYSINYFKRFFHKFDVIIWIFFIIMSFSSILSLKRILNESIILATLNFMQLLSSTPILKKPTNLIGRIIFIVIILFTFLTTSVIQSSLSAFKTVPSTASTIDSAEDLIKSNLTPMGTPNYMNLLKHKEIRKRFREVSSFSDCLYKLAKHDQIACLEDYLIMRFYLAENENIHISRYSLLKRSLTYLIALDSPFLRHLDRVLRGFNEGGLIEMMFNHEEEFCYLRSALNTELAMSLKIIDLIASLYILLIGWIWATIIFILEILIYYIKSVIFKL